jgi:hypothetical protein
MGYVHGEFKPTAPDKYVGTYPIYFRSSWEFKLMKMLDTHPNIINWASESIKIPYINPFTNKYSVYVPDFLIISEDKNGNRKAEIIEVKPLKETTMEEAKGAKDKAAVALNSVKWKAATEWAKHHGMSFRVMTENHIFDNPKKRR